MNLNDIQAGADLQFGQIDLHFCRVDLYFWQLTCIFRKLTCIFVQLIPFFGKSTRNLVIQTIANLTQHFLKSNGHILKSNGHLSKSNGHILTSTQNFGQTICKWKRVWTIADTTHICIERPLLLYLFITRRLLTGRISDVDLTEPILEMVICSYFAVVNLWLSLSTIFFMFSPRSS